MLGAKGWTSLRYVVIPAALPSVVSGLKQGWAFAWRSLMAGELITIFPGHIGIGALLNNAYQNADFIGVYETMIVIFVVGVAVDALVLRHDRARDPQALRPHRRRQLIPHGDYRSRSSTSNLVNLSPTLVACATSMPSTTWPKRL